MGQAKRRGTFEQRKAEAIEAGRIPAIRRLKQREARINRRIMINAYLEYLAKMQSELMNNR